MASSFIEAYVPRVELSLGQFAIVDDCDMDSVSAHRWLALYDRKLNKYYAYIHHTVDGTRKILRMHKFILRSPDGAWVDHVNGDTLDNRRANLRIVSPIQNQQNRRKRSIGSSKFKGVFWDTQRRKWKVTIQIDKRRKFIGCYVNEFDAACAYDKAARQYFGEFACGNFPAQPCDSLESPTL